MIAFKKRPDHVTTNNHPIPITRNVQGTLVCYTAKKQNWLCPSPLYRRLYSCGSEGKGANDATFPCLTLAAFIRTKQADSDPLERHISCFL